MALTKSRLSSDEHALDWSRQSYHWMIEASSRDIGEATAKVTQITIEDPLRVELTFPNVRRELRDRTAKALRAVFERVQLIARISNSGEPTAQPGDIAGELILETSMALSGTVVIDMDQVVQ